MAETSALPLQRELIAAKRPSPFSPSGLGNCPAEQRLNQKLSPIFIKKKISVPNLSYSSHKEHRELHTECTQLP